MAKQHPQRTLLQSQQSESKGSRFLFNFASFTGTCCGQNDFLPQPLLCIKSPQKSKQSKVCKESGFAPVLKLVHNAELQTEARVFHCLLAWQAVVWCNCNCNAAQCIEHAQWAQGLTCTKHVGRNSNQAPMLEDNGEEQEMLEAAVEVVAEMQLTAEELKVNRISLDEL